MMYNIVFVPLSTYLRESLGYKTMKGIWLAIKTYYLSLVIFIFDDIAFKYPIKFHVEHSTEIAHLIIRIILNRFPNLIR